MSTPGKMAEQIAALQTQVNALQTQVASMQSHACEHAIDNRTRAEANRKRAGFAALAGMSDREARNQAIAALSPTDLAGFFADGRDVTKVIREAPDHATADLWSAMVPDEYVRRLVRAGTSRMPSRVRVRAISNVELEPRGIAIDRATFERLAALGGDTSQVRTERGYVVEELTPHRQREVQRYRFASFAVDRRFVWVGTRELWELHVEIDPSLADLVHVSAMSEEESRKLQIEEDASRVRGQALRTLERLPVGEVQS